MALQTKNLIFTAEKTDLQGYLAWNEDQDGTRPAVLVFPEWWGLNDYIKKRAEQVASLGYLAMGVDMYGNGKTAEHPEEAGSLMNGVLGDLDLLKSGWKRRINPSGMRNLPIPIGWERSVTVSGEHWF